MKIFRPKNINKRLSGTVVGASSTTRGGSPGNGNVIGPNRTPYCILQCPTNIELGNRYHGGGGGCNAGVFRLNESFCGNEECCVTGPSGDCGGYYLCCGPGTSKWFVAPSCTQVTRNWYNREDSNTVATACMGSCGWFVPSCGNLSNPGYACRTYWDEYDDATSDVNKRYWTNNAGNQYTTFSFNMGNGCAYVGYVCCPKKSTALKVRSMWCSA